MFTKVHRGVLIGTIATNLVWMSLIILSTVNNAGTLPDCWEDEAVVMVISNFEGKPWTFETGAVNPLPTAHVGCVPWDDIDAGNRP